MVLPKSVWGPAAVAVALLLGAMLLAPGASHDTPVMARAGLGNEQPDRDDEPLRVPPASGALEVARGWWDGVPVVVFAAPHSLVVGAKMPATIVHPEAADHVLFAYSAKSTHRGCTVQWHPGLGEDLDGRLLDVCHHGQWDALAGGQPLPGSPAPVALAKLHVRAVGVDDGFHVWGTGFEGQVGPAATLWG